MRGDVNALIVIPARYASSRCSGKPLLPLSGATGIKKTLLHRSWEAARAAHTASRILVATDDQRIRAEADRIGAEVVMTPASCGNGTERCAAALDTLADHYEIIVNLQGDAPLTPPWMIDDVIAALRDAPDHVGVATPVVRCDAATAEALRQDRRADRVGGTTAVFDRHRRALYFSKEVLPFAGADIFHHVGLYAYTDRALADYRAHPPGPLEGAEGLEQLRFLEHGQTILCVESDLRGRPFWELNNPSDVAIIERMLAAAGIA